MITLTIDNQPVEIKKGATILQAAKKLDIHIPTLCWRSDCNPSTSCMVCVVRVEGMRTLVPACATKVTDGMIVDTQSGAVTNARKAAIELLLSDHVGDCVGPCEKGCPAGMDIPKMIRQIAAGDFKTAIQTVKKDIPLPAILGRICSAPCEKVCRRNQADQAVSICLLKRFVADVDLDSGKPYTPTCAASIGKQVAVIGAGPCGLSAAYYLKQQGVDCTIYDTNDKPGGSLLSETASKDILPTEVVEKEINQLLSLGIELKCGIEIGKDVAFDELAAQYDAVLIATGDTIPSDCPIEAKDGKIQANRRTYATEKQGIFAAGTCIGSRPIPIRAVADGKEAAASIAAFLTQKPINAPKDYNHRMGRLEKDEIQRFLEHVSKDQRIEPENVGNGLDASQARSESARCLHCDCRKAQNCQLRNLATELAARQSTWQGSKNLFEQVTAHEKIIFEPGKCIKCGLCIQTAQKKGQSIGLAFKGRGFQMSVGVSLEKTFTEGLTTAAEKCVQVCPTGALAMKSVDELKQKPGTEVTG
ncbi:MAG: 2Fe-2S iron-sulfur cluster-binding protein [Planctomycetota bacterium]|jgi:NADPH-dependent glutamate synthase beta subunit-like oxidoreductase